MIITYSRFAQYKTIAVNTIKRYFGTLQVAIEKHEIISISSHICQSADLSSNITQSISLSSIVELE